jgi:hypothetical protein
MWASFKTQRPLDLLHAILKYFKQPPERYK